MSTLTWVSPSLSRLSDRASAVAGATSSTGPAPMHIPDGFLSTPVSLLLWAVAILGVGYALARVNRDFDDRKVPLMGVMAATIFAGQMLNFSVTGGTSGHLMGAALAAIVLGPWAAVLVLACVVGTQALLFQDGGLLALGANVVNMALVGVTVGYAVYMTVRKLAGPHRWALFSGSFAAGWLSIVLSALFVGLQLAASGTQTANVAVPAMGGIHMLIGVGEGLITAGAVALLYTARRDLFMAGQGRLAAGRGVWVVGLLIAVLLAVLSPYASQHPDGLEWVAEQQGFLGAAQDAPFRIIPDYVFPGISNERVATIAAGVIGLVVVVGVTYLMTASRRKRESSRSV